MFNYSLVIGPNNCGKTNLIDALRVFYEKDKYRYDPVRDAPRFNTCDDETWIDIQFILTDAEYDSLKSEYQLPRNKLRVRKYLRCADEPDATEPRKLGIYGYTESGLCSELFYGASGVQQGKLGDVVYIPAASRLDDHMKLSGPSEFRDLVNRIIKDISATSPSFKALAEEFKRFSATLRDEQTKDGTSLNGLMEEIDASILEWGNRSTLNINPMNETDIVKNLVSLKFMDDSLSGTEHSEFDPSQFGQGFQRHLVFTLVQLAAKYQARPKPIKSKDFRPVLTLYLFEEPEAFLHPAQQGTLCRNLQTLAGHEGTQVLVTSHSSQFVSLSADNLTSIVRLCRDEAHTELGQITEERKAELFHDNSEINKIVPATADDDREDMEAIKHFMWLDPHRCGMFFAGHVLLVEGPTERVLLDFLIGTGRISSPKGGLFILECIGKYNMHRFMGLLAELNVNHSVLLDGDDGKGHHKEVQQFIQDRMTVRTVSIDAFDSDIEGFLKIGKPTGKDSRRRKPQHLMLQHHDGNICDKRLEALIDKVHALINGAPVPSHA